MERDIADRYQTASELAQDIFNWLEGAQKRDKALNEYSMAVDLHKEAEQIETDYTAIWNKINATIESNNAISDAEWTLWEEANELMQQQAKISRQDYRSALQGALVYDPELIEANEALANLLMKDIMRAVANGAVKESQLHRKTSPKISAASSENVNNRPSWMGSVINALMILYS